MGLWKDGETRRNEEKGRVRNEGRLEGSWYRGQRAVMAKGRTQVENEGNEE